MRVHLVISLKCSDILEKCEKFTLQSNRKYLLTMTSMKPSTWDNSVFIYKHIIMNNFSSELINIRNNY